MLQWIDVLMTFAEIKKEPAGKEITSQTSTPGQRRLHDSTHGAKASAGHKSMQLLKLPPGQPEGVGLGVGAGGVGVGVGLGLGPGVGESVVEPIGPNLMSEKIT